MASVSAARRSRFPRPILGYPVTSDLMPQHFMAISVSVTPQHFMAAASRYVSVAPQHFMATASLSPSLSHYEDSSLPPPPRSPLT